MGEVVNFIKYKTRYDQARFYWRMTKCSYRELARHSGIRLDVAREWELKFIKEKEKEKENVERT